MAVLTYLYLIINIKQGGGGAGARGTWGGSGASALSCIYIFIYIYIWRETIVKIHATNHNPIPLSYQVWLVSDFIGRVLPVLPVIFIGRVLPVIIWDAPLPPLFGRSGFPRLHLAAAFKHNLHKTVFFFCTLHSYLPGPDSWVLRHSFMYLGRVVPVKIRDAPLLPQRWAASTPMRSRQSQFIRCIIADCYCI